jgi:hypothetical protein
VVHVVGKERFISAEIEQAIADASAIADQIGAAGSKEERWRLADLLCRKVNETIGMMALADPAAWGDRRRIRRPSLARIAKQATKAGVEMRVSPDGTIIVLPKPTEGPVTSPDPQGDLDKWLAKRHAN